MIRQNVGNFKIGTLHKTKVIGSSGLALLMTFAQDVGLGKELDWMFSSLKQRRGHSVSAKVLSFLQMIIKGGDRLSDLEVLRADPGLLTLLRMESVPRPNTMAELARKFRRRDIHRLAECGMRLGVRALAQRKPKRLILDIDSTLVESDMKIAKKTYEGFRGFNPLLGMVRGGGLNLAAFSVFRLGNEASQEHNLSLVRKNIRYLKTHLPVIQGIRGWKELRGSGGKEEIGEGIHFVGPEKKGDAYRLIIVRRRNDQRALFPELEYSYRIYVTNTPWSPTKVVRFYRRRGDAENVIRELKDGFGIDHILAGEFLAASVFFQLQLLAYNLVQVFKAEYLDRSWWVLRMKQLRYRLINIAGLVVRHARKTVLRLSIHYRHLETFQRVFQKLQIRPVEMRL